MALPLVPLDSADEKQHRTIIATVLNELAKQYPKHGSWTAAIRGSGTAGTYELASQISRYSRYGRRVFIDTDITLAGAITAGGTGYMQITGAPYSKAASTNPIGHVWSSGLDFTTSGAFLSAQFISTTETSVLYLREHSDNAVGTDFQIVGLAANDIIRVSICYETDDP
jgi:hypothetical protein